MSECNLMQAPRNIWKTDLNISFYIGFRITKSKGYSGEIRSNVYQYACILVLIFILEKPLVSVMLLHANQQAAMIL